MPNIIIDNIPISAADGTSVLEAARTVGIHIPALCFLKGHPALTSCMVCLVRINGAKKLSPACATVVSEGMVIESETEEIIKARRTALELLLGDHRGDCTGPCQDVCPAHMDIPRMIALLAEEKFREAIIVIKQRIALPATLGRICSQMCEKGCRRGHVDAAVSICALKRFAADRDLFSDSPYVPVNLPETGKKVAVIGAGPCGLSAAYYLARAGHRVHLYDSMDQPGGSLRSVVGQDRLPAEVLDAEIGLLLRSGIVFHGQSPVNSLDSFSAEHDAVILCVGSVEAEMCTRWGFRYSGKGIQVDPTGAMTDRTGVFAAGSCVAPVRQAVRACAQGRHVALSVSAYLSGDKVPIDDRPYGVRMGHLLPGELKALSEPRSMEPRASDTALSEEQVIKETSRCLHCECAKADSCRLRKISYSLSANPTAYRREHRQYTRDISHPKVVLERSKCIGCGMCVQITQNNAEKLGLTFKGRGFDVEIGVPFGAELPDALTDTALECARACPTAAIHIKREGVE